MTDDAAAPTTGRLESIDLVRGAIMILMALDHVRDFFGVPGVNPVNLAQTTVALFMTRWVTHVCAPVFFLLTGTGAFLSLRRRSAGELSRFLFTRGLWLIVLELTIVRCLAYQFNADYQVTMLLVLWALGWAMISLSALVWLPAPFVTAIGAAMMAGHNLLDGVRSASPVWAILHRPGFVVSGPHVVFASYPLVPWVGVTAFGYGLGRIYRWEAGRRRRILGWLGGGFILAFVALRALNVYGDPSRWATQAASAMTLVSFLNTTKYPPSLLFLLMTLGPALLFLRAVDGGTPRVLRPVLVYGQVPMFYYVLHFALVHALAVLACYARYGTAHWMFESPNLGQYPYTAPPGWGWPLPVVYAIWMLVVVTLYPACRWFASVKQRRREPWLSYL
jgi:uncharacterized membrane protein